jgi:hypothetical protein
VQIRLLKNQQLYKHHVSRNEKIKCMTEDLFTKLIQNTESSVLDFKREQYKLINDSTGEETAKFVKDMICFCNTIRENSAYIIIGIGIDGSHEKEFLGLNIHIDESIFQDKIKDKVSPRPIFKYYTFEYYGKTYGVLDFPIYKYTEPLTPIVKMKGLEIGKIYFRRGSTNSECNGREIIQINDWFRRLKQNLNPDERTKKITELLAKINSNSQLLSTCVAECLQIAKEIEDDSLKMLCKAELQGWHIVENPTQAQIKHRKVKVIVSPLKITDVNSYGNYTVRHMWDELRSKEDFYEIPAILGEPLSNIEQNLENFKLKDNNCFVTFERKANEILPKSNLGKMPIYIYSNNEIHAYLYNNIKQKFINELIDRL